ncbi:MAG: zinc-ribbon domain-containing protein [Deltaproteobacteria bacterium]|nr:zinc-ribbon domain-containing protein [Deltaproteobacteria bacterium]
MDVVCNKCQGSFKIPDEKVPKGKVFSIACPKCKNKISVDPRPAEPLPAEETLPDFDMPKSAPGKSILDEVADSTYDASDKPFDFVEEGTETALLCESDPAIREKIRTALSNLGYHITESESARDVLKQMRFHVFEVVILNELFDTRDPDENNILRYLDRLGMDTRRDMFVALVTDRFRTNDYMAAFHKSVNLIINRNNIDQFEKILTGGIAENTAFYRVFKESMVKVGMV